MEEARWFDPVLLELYTFKKDVAAILECLGYCQLNHKVGYKPYNKHITLFECCFIVECTVLNKLKKRDKKWTLQNIKSPFCYKFNISNK